MPSADARSDAALPGLRRSAQTALVPLSGPGQTLRFLT